MRLWGCCGVRVGRCCVVSCLAICLARDGPRLLRWVWVWVRVRVEVRVEVRVRV